MKTLLTFLLLLMFAKADVTLPNATAILPPSGEAGCNAKLVGDWSFSAHPFLGEGYESRPVIVSATRTVAKSLTITEVRIRNISSKSVSAVKLGWFIVSRNNPSVILTDGVSPLIPIESSLAVGDTTLLKLPLMSFSEIGPQLAKKAPLLGPYDAFVFVKEILFDDRSTWTVGEKVILRSPVSNISYIKAAFAQRPAVLTVVPLAKPLICPKQQCDFVSDPNPGYTCKGSTNEEYCTNCITSCCSTICSDPTPSCGPCG